MLLLNKLSNFVVFPTIINQFSDFCNVCYLGKTHCIHPPLSITFELVPLRLCIGIFRVPPQLLPRVTNTTLPLLILSLSLLGFTF
jgi:hypothetical protein